MKDKTNISKRDLWCHVNRKLRHSIHRHHVFAIISLLFEEMIIDLQQGKTIKITNLGQISLDTTRPRKYYHIHLRQVMWSKGNRLIKFLLAPPIRKKLVQFLDIDKTFESSSKQNMIDGSPRIRYKK